MKRVASQLDVASSAPRGEAPANAGKSGQEGGGKAGSGSHLTRKSSPGEAGGLMLTQRAGAVGQGCKIALFRRPVLNGTVQDLSNDGQALPTHCCLMTFARATAGIRFNTCHSPEPAISQQFERGKHWRRIRSRSRVAPVHFAVRVLNIASASRVPVETSFDKTLICSLHATLSVGYG